jgi:parvulin-like peptidyl-prolyl isomerase
MKFIKKGVFILSTIFFVLFLLACGNFQTASGEVLATVNGTSITQTELDQTLESIAVNNYGMTTEEVEAMFSEDGYAAYKNNVLNSLIQKQLMVENAQKNGFSDEDLATLETATDSIVAQTKNSIYSQMAGDTGILSIAAQLEAEEYYQRYIQQNGNTREDIYNAQLELLVQEKFYASVMAEFVLSEEDIQTAYDEMLSVQQALDAASPDAAFSDFTTRASQTSQTEDVTVYIPQNAETQARYARHILLQIPAETQEEITHLQEDEAAEEDNGHDHEYSATELEAQALEDLHTEAERIYTQLQNGADFETLLEEYGTDTGMAYYPEGYLLYEGAPYVSEFLEAGLALSAAGDISQPVLSEYGYHIIQYTSQPQAGPIPLDEIYEEVESYAYSEYSYAFWQDALSALMENADITKVDFTTQS